MQLIDFEKVARSLGLARSLVKYVMPNNSSLYAVSVGITIVGIPIRMVLSDRLQPRGLYSLA